MTTLLHEAADDLTLALRAGQTLAPGVRRLGRPLRYWPVIDSTQRPAHRAAQEGAAEGLVILADEQTAGKGRLGRVWEAPAGSGLLMSLLLRPNDPHPGPPRPIVRAQQGSQLTMCVGLGAAAAVEEITGLAVQLKWPNDLLLHGRKLAGILTETQLDGDRIVYAVTGLGLNVNWILPSAHPLAAGAISLAQALGRPVSRLALLGAILRQIEEQIEHWQAGHSPYVAWSQRMAYDRQMVQVTLGDATLTGILSGVNQDGALLLQDAGGVTHTIWAGDVQRLVQAAAPAPEA